MATVSGLQISPFMAMMIGLLFIFSTAYGLMFYYYQGAQQSMSVNGLDSNVRNPNTLDTSGGFLSSFVSGAIDTLLNFISWISPFSLIRGLIYAISPSDLFQVLDLFLLRPISWAVSIITANLIIAKVRGTSEGT